MTKNLQDVLFEGFVHESNSYTTYYYIQLYKGAFLFKMGISKLGAVIKHYEDNRLNVAIGTKEEYQALMKELQMATELYCAYGHDECYHWYYRFKNEIDVEADAPLVGGISPVIHILERYFDNKIAILSHSENKNIIDTFTLDGKKKYIIHDSQYLWTSQNIANQKKGFGKKEMQTLLDKHFYGYEDSPHIAVKEKYALMKECPDLTKELLYVLENERYPEEVIVVDGWAAKDFVECADCDVAEAYFHLMNLRKNPDEENNCLYEWLKLPYSGLYEHTEIQKGLEFIKKMAEQKEKAIETRNLEQERLSLDNGIPMRNGKIDMSPKPTIAQWLEMANRQQKVMPSIEKAKYREFLAKYTIPMIHDEIKKYIIGQDELVEHVSTFIYYHALRQVKPTLHPRPFLIAGPSGSGKTEAFRVVKNVFKEYFNVEIVDGTTITQEGWKGARKLSVLLGSLSNGYILVIDEFDKLAKPAYDSGNNNVSEHIQAEFLKLLEGEYYTKDLQTDTSRKTRKEVAIDYDTKTLGIVLVGAFEAIRSKKENPPTRVGFIQSEESTPPFFDKEVVPDRDRTHGRKMKPVKEKNRAASKTPEATEEKKIIEITDEDLIAYGVIPELVGRISDKCTTNKLTVEQYIQIVKNENSKVSQLMKELEQLGVETDDILNDDLIADLVEKSQTNLLGVRWVSSQIENLLLKQLSNVDIRCQFANNDSTLTENIEPDDESLFF